ncbi:MAG: hypothetical protein ACM4AI_09720, partial [Acidobacteriota bacterium]
MTRIPILFVLTLVAVLAGACGGNASEPADLLLVNGRVYTFSWPEPDREGTPSITAPHGPLGWRPDAQAVA